MPTILGQRNKCKFEFGTESLDHCQLTPRYSGLGTVYIQRMTEDLDENMTTIRKEVDLFIDGTQGVKSCGLGELADLLGA